VDRKSVRFRARCTTARPEDKESSVKIRRNSHYRKEGLCLSSRNAYRIAAKKPLGQLKRAGKTRMQVRMAASKQGCRGDFVHSFYEECFFYPFAERKEFKNR